ncbi:RNA polymerase sigma factor [Puteibacter caeruleilacunae]|nr:RNA polymerase sigma factor [Puteibacter caeruleilacunae]
MVNRLSANITGDNAVADDITQEVFIDLYHQLQQKKKIKSMRNWLYRIAANKSINHIRKNAKWNDNEVDKIKVSTQDDESKDELIGSLRESLSKLSEHDRMLVVLYSEGLSYKEIAEVTGIRFSSIGKLLSRSIQKLRKTFKVQHDEVYTN